MNADSIAYLANHTDITYLTEGSVARSLVEATNVEISRLQEYIASSYRNVFPNTAEGFYLDLIGEGIGLARAGATRGSSGLDDQNVKFSVVVGALGDYFANPADSNLGLIPKGTTISTGDETIVYEVSQNTTFPFSAKEAFVPVVATTDGVFTRVGKNKLVLHSGSNMVNVTNVKPIANASTGETDRSYRFRLLNHLTASPTGNQLSVKLSVIGNPDIARVELKEFARGAGTFDALLVPVGNTVSTTTQNRVQASIDQASSFGINGKAVQPQYRRFRVSIQLIPVKGKSSGLVDSAKISAKNAVLDYFETIPIGGELIINRLRSSIIESVNDQIKDIKILDLCLDGRPHVIRNIKLKPDELFTPDVSRESDAIQIV